MLHIDAHLLRWRIGHGAQLVDLGSRQSRRRDGRLRGFGYGKAAVEAMRCSMQAGALQLIHGQSGTPPDVSERITRPKHRLITCFRGFKTRHTHPFDSPIPMNTHNTS